MSFQELFCGFPPDTFRPNEPLYKHTSFKIGGPADLMFLPQSKEQLCDAVKILIRHSVPYFIMGNGTNLLVSDEGYRGVIIKTDNLSKAAVNGHKLYAEAGVSLAQAASAALNASLTGLEFASGIPGSFGGALCMNAGAYGGEIKDGLTQAEVIDSSGEVYTISNTQAEFSYRGSRIQREGLIVLSGILSLERGEASKIKARSAELNAMRRQKQPLEYPSAGSAFKRPPGHFAGKLIMDSGLSGYSIGGAMVSPKHCGFIINTGGATCAEVLELISYIKTTVQEQFEIELKPEIKII